MRLRRFLRVVVPFSVVQLFIAPPLSSVSATAPPTTTPPTTPTTSGPTNSNATTTQQTGTTTGTTAPASDRLTACDDLSEQVTALLAYTLSFTDGSPVVDAVVTLDQSATAAPLLPRGSTVRSQVVVVPCDLTATLEPLGANAQVSTSGPQFATLGPGDPARFHWLLAGSGDTVSLQLSDLNGVPSLTLDIFVPHLAFTCFRDPCGSEVAASPTTLSALPVIVPANTTRPVIPVVSPETIPRDPSTTSSQVASEAPNPADRSSSINTPATAALAQCAQHVTDILNARIVYEPKSTMRVGESNPVEAVITLDLVTAPASVFGDTNATVTAQDVLLPCRIEAKLDGLASDFEISPTDFDERELAPGKDARWVWNVKPLQIRDNLPLTLLVRGKVSDGQTTQATAFKKTIVVTALSNIGKAESGLPTGLLAAVALTGVIGAGAVWQVRRRNRTTHRILNGTSAAAVGSPNGASVFVSYSSKDSDSAAEIVRTLEVAGYEVWRDTDDIRGGERWRRSITSGITSARLVMLLVSPNSLASENVERELSIAQDQNKRILPVSIAPAIISEGFQYLLAGVQILDLNGVARADRNRVLLSAVAAILPLPVVTAPTAAPPTTAPPGFAPPSPLANS